MTNDVDGSAASDCSTVCERCGGKSSVPRHGVNVCFTCLHHRQEVCLMVREPEPGLVQDGTVWEHFFHPLR
jgi:hypothetical protein